MRTATSPITTPASAAHTLKWVSQQPHIPLTLQQRAAASESALASVRAEGLDPAGVEPDLLAWVLGEITIDTVIQRLDDKFDALYGPPGSKNR